MSELDDSFSALLGRQPSDAEKQHLHQVKTALGLRNNDALWLLLIALEHYHHLYEEVPGRIEELTRRTLYGIQATAETAMREAAEITKMELARAVAATAQTVAQDTATRQKWQWLTVGVGAVALALLVAAGAGYWLGKEAGLAESEVKAREAQAAAVWATTPDGQLAYRWAQTGELQRLARCDDSVLARDRQQGRAVCLAKKGSGWWLP